MLKGTSGQIKSKWEKKDRVKDFYDNRNIAAGYTSEDWGKIESTVSPEHWAILQKRNEKGWNCDWGWKIHLDVIPNREHPVTRKISDFLLDLRVSHKIAAGGDCGKGMTIYVGSYDDTCKLAQIIYNRFGNEIAIPPYFADLVKEEYPFEPTVYGTFCIADFDCYPKYGLGVRPFVKPPKGQEKVKHEKMLACFDEATKAAQEVGLSVPNFFERKNKEQYVSILQHYCSHKLYVRAFGAYYYGSDLNEFEQKIFGDKVPNNGTILRNKWDFVANIFVNMAQSNGFLQQLVKSSGVEGYIPVDFDKIKMRQLVSNIMDKWHRG